MKLPLFCLPNLNWMSSMFQIQLLHLCNETSFPKQTYRNRVEINTANGTLLLTIPIDGSTKHEEYKKVKIQNDNVWKKQWIKSLRSAYNNSPYYEYYGYKLEDIINNSELYLWNKNIQLLHFVFQSLNLDVHLSDYNSYFTDEEFNIKKHYCYYQTHQNEVFSTVSVIDLIFNEGPDAYKTLYNHNKIEHEPLKK